MIIYQTNTPKNTLTEKEISEISQFLHQHLEQFADSSTAIEKAIAYALKIKPSFGGFVMRAVEDQQLIGAVVVNRTGMSQYIPENILVYIAVHRDYRGRGIGKELMQEAIQQCKGNIALHVESGNPARKLYEKLGFRNKYLEMRLEK